MATMNTVIVMGNLTRDPELRHLPSGATVCEMGLAINERSKSPSGEWKEETLFLDVTAWAHQADYASNYLSKGSPVLIEGRLKSESWEKDGQKRTKLKVVANRVTGLDRRNRVQVNSQMPSEELDDAAF